MMFPIMVHLQQPTSGHDMACTPASLFLFSGEESHRAHSDQGPVVLKLGAVVRPTLPAQANIQPEEAAANPTKPPDLSWMGQARALFAHSLYRRLNGREGS